MDREGGFIATGFVVVVILTLAAMLLAVLWHRKLEKRREESLNAISFVLGAKLQRNTLQGTFGNYDYSCIFFGEGTGESSCAIFTLHVLLPFKIRVIKEKTVHKLSKGIGLSVEIQAGDQKFDKMYYVDADDPDTARVYLSESNNLTVIEEIFNIWPEVRIVTLSSEGISVEIRPFHPEDMRPKELETLLSLTTKLTDRMDKAVLIRIEPEKLRQRTNKAIAVITLIILGIFGILFTLFVGITGYVPLENRIYYDAFYYSLLPTGALLIASYFLVRGRSNSHVQLIVILVFSFLVFPLIGKEIMLFVNGRYDTAQSQKHTVPVTKKAYNRRTGWVVYVPSWTKTGEQNRISVSKSFCLGLKEGELINVETKPGYYGYEWIHNVSKHRTD